MATKWLRNPEKFEDKWTPRRIRHDLFEQNQKRRSIAYEQFYEVLCMYAHPSSRGWQEQIVSSKILWRPIFDSDYSSECFGLIFFVVMQSFKPFLEVSQKRMPQEIIDDANRTLTKVEEMLTRHFQVAKGRGGREA